MRRYREPKNCVRSEAKESLSGFLKRGGSVQRVAADPRIAMASLQETSTRGAAMRLVFSADGFANDGNNRVSGSTPGYSS